MARLSRLCIPGWPHVLLQRGHNRQAAFVDDVDRKLFRELLQDGAIRHGVQIHAYALVDDEVRLLATPAAADSFSQLMQSIGRRYVATFNRRHGRSGSLWEGRFRTTVVEPEQHLLRSMRFVEGLAVGGSGGLGLSPWTSAGHHLGARIDPLITEPAQFWSLGNTPFEREAVYRLLAEQGLTTAETQQIEAAVTAGWPLGQTSFLKGLKAKTPRRLAPLPRGRPKKAVASDPI
ncbi:MAG: transposase [Rhizobacter sp.]